MEEIIKVGILMFLCCIVSIYTTPVEIHYKEIISPEKAVLIVEVDPASQEPLSNRVPRQDFEGGDGDGEEVDPNNVPLTPAQLNGIGNNVAKVVSSALTGNVGGIVNGGLTLLNTRNRVNDLLATFGVTDKPAQNATLKANATTLATTTVSDDEDDEEDYPQAEITNNAKKSKTYFLF